MKPNIKNLGFFLVVLLFFLVEAKGLARIDSGDENVYYYMAKMISENKYPYSDFFYAHPPLHIFILAIIIKIFGVNFMILKSASLAALIISSYFLYKTSIELFQNRLGDKNAELISVLAVVFYLFSFEVMFKATFSMGINFSLMFLMAGFFFTFTNKSFIGGIFVGFAGLTRFYTLPIILAVFLFIFIKNAKSHKLREFFHLISGFLLIFGITIAILIFLYGNNFIDPVVKYHLLKPELPNQRLNVYKHVLKEDFVILTLFLSSILMLNKKNFILFYFAAFVHLISLLFLNVPFEFYFGLAFPFMAVIGAYSLTQLLRKISNKYFKYALTTLLAAVFLWNTAADIMFLEKIGFIEFSPLNPLVNTIEATNPEEKLFGDDSIVPLIALLANRSIALNYIDSNEMRLTSGLVNFFILTDKLDDEKLSYIILRKNRGMHQILEMRHYVESRCKFNKEYFDNVEGSFLVYKC